MLNDINKTGGELIVDERDRQVMNHNFTIESDARVYRNGELVNTARAIIDCNAELAPEGYLRTMAIKFIELPAVERLIVAGAFIAAQIDVFNYFTNMGLLMQKYAANVPEKKIYIPESEN